MGDTAIRAVTFSISALMGRANTSGARDGAVEVWNVATIGPSASNRASDDRLNVPGSCRCRTSKSWSASQRRTRAYETGPNVIRATEPLYGTLTARPAGVTK